jgi:hypothetical protein
MAEGKDFGQFDGEQRKYASTTILPGELTTSLHIIPHHSSTTPHTTYSIHHSLKNERDW